ncbi:ABC transporter permease [Acidocella aromatica]|uniref:Putative spermidine/putrescine transport system permease protein n=1 Tax=Acidocella aromatica TaxID=1303579 RepID=A0A840VNT9_9PROT|nr:ABC transporter permease [Acidocella aromatica]MBB5373819.1 putative spermidine/putrescine transport system permease protein [Acidocella aromatica]
MRSEALIWAAVAAIMGFLFIPIVIIIAYAFSAAPIPSWPITSFALHWFSDTWNDDEIRQALALSVEVAALATISAILLGTLAAMAVARMKSAAKEVVSFIAVLPIALPGILTGMALASYFAFWGLNLSYWTIVAGHATFCIVIVYNNVIARLRRMPRSLTEASADLGADAFLTFRRVQLPMMASAIGAGALLAFALSFDEVIVTTFTAGAQNTLPLWIFGAIRLGQKLPEVNVVVFAIILFTAVPVLLAQKLIGESGRVAR